MDLKKKRPDFSSANTFLPNPTILLLDLSVLCIIDTWFFRKNFRSHPLAMQEFSTCRNDFYIRCAWARGTFFPVVLLCQFFGFWRGNRFWCYMLTYLEYVQQSCGVVLVFWFWREIVFGVTYVLIEQYSCAVVSVFCLWREIVLKMRTPFWAITFDFPNTATKKKSTSASLFMRNDLLAKLCFLFCYFVSFLVCNLNPTICFS